MAKSAWNSTIQPRPHQSETADWALTPEHAASLPCPPRAHLPVLGTRTGHGTDHILLLALSHSHYNGFRWATLVRDPAIRYSLVQNPQVFRIVEMEHEWFAAATFA